jgi:Ti-type conjugative transfer relaxase TraA
MAIYHFSAKVIQRSHGRSAVAAAAYRSASELEDERLGQTFDYRAKEGVEHSEIIAPDDAPGRWQDRSTLWNEVEAIERRKDAVLAREIEFALPRELSQAEGIALAQDFVREQFVARGMVADLNVHWTRDPDGEVKPHAHVMLSMRVVEGDGFGKKQRDWNEVGLLRTWRERWAELSNERLLALGHDITIDHRSYAAQGIELEPQNKIGPAGARREARGEEAERAAEHEALARRNGERIIADPGLALEALTRQQSTFTRRDLARLVDRHTADAEQFAAAMARVEASPALVRLGTDGHDRERFTTRAMLATEQRMEQAAGELAARQGHRVNLRRRLAESSTLGREQVLAFRHVTQTQDLAVVVGYAGTGKSTMLGEARAAWEADGYQVRGAALSGIAAEQLEGGAGIASRTVHSLLFQWEQGREALTNRDVLVVDEAGMLGSRQMERLLSQAQAAGAKVVLVGDPEQLQAIEAGAAFRAIAERVGAVEITEIRRQREAWQQAATRDLATGRTGEALARYEAAGMVMGHATLDDAKAAMIAGWDAARQEAPEARQIMLAYRRVDVRDLNERARAVRQAAGELGADYRVQTERGGRDFAAGDRVYFLRNERGLGVKNGTLGTVVGIAGPAPGLGERLTVRLDDGRVVGFDVKDYGHIDHGYAATVHKSQGVTVDRTHVLATSHVDRHAAYVGLSRHRERVDLHWSADEMGSRERLTRVLGRERLKDTSLDYGLAPGGTARQPEIRPESDDSVRAYAERRGLVPPDGRVPESEIIVQGRPVVAAPVQEAPKPAARRGKFSGLKLDARRTSDAVPDPERLVSPAESTPARVVMTELERRQEQMERLAASYARAWGDAERMRRKGLPVLPHQAQALQAADRALEAFDSGAGRDVRGALEAAPALAGWIETKNGRQALTAAAMDVRRDRQALDRRVREAVRGWVALEQAHDQAASRYDWDAARAVTQRLETYAQTLKQDPQLEGVLRTRGAEFGVEKGSRLERVVLAPEVTERLIRQVGLEQARGRSHGPSMGM